MRTPYLIPTNRFRSIVTNIFASIFVSNFALIFVSIFSLPGHLSIAHEGEGTAIRPVKVQTFSLSKNDKLHVLVRNDSHAEGKKFLVELRPSCGRNQDWSKSAVVDMQSACDVDTKFLKFDPQAKKLLVRIKDPNSNQRNFNSVNEKLDAPVDCNQQWKLFSFDLSSICQ